MFKYLKDVESGNIIRKRIDTGVIDIITTKVTINADGSTSAIRNLTSYAFNEPCNFGATIPITKTDWDVFANKISGYVITA